MNKLFCVTDIHGSNVCYRKFLNALPIYGADVAVLIGDLTGKVLVPLVEKGGGPVGMHPDGAVPRDQRRKRSSRTSRRSSRTRATTGCTRRARSSTTRAPTRPRSTRCSRASSSSACRSGSTSPTSVSRASRTRCTWRPGNDDWFVIDDMIDNAKLVHPCDKRVVEIDDHEMITSSASNPTPWDTPREMSEEDLETHLRELCAQGQEPRDGDLQLPRAAVRLLARPVPQARREPHHGRRREDPRRQPRRQARSSRSTSRCSACTATSTSRAARRRPAARCSSTRAASTPRASSRASSSCSTRRRSRTTSSPPGDAGA